MSGSRWDTSTWPGTTGRTLLPVPKPIRQALGDGDVVTVTIAFTL